jgi:deoxyribonuclease-4
VGRALAIGAEAIQIFASGPQSWRFKPLPKEQATAFREKAADAGDPPVFLHGVYLVNLATQVPENLEKSIQSLVDYMVVAHQIGAKGVIFHIGSHKGAGYERMLGQVADSMAKVLEKTPDDTWLIIENSAGMGQHVGAKLSDIGTVIKEIESPRLMVCLDTEHAFAAGYDVASKDGLAKTIDEFHATIGLDRLVAVHANDSKGPLGWGVDRHENIGEGQIGIKGFEIIMAHPAFRDVPFLLEVPGFDKQGPDKQNVDILKGIWSRVGGKG